MYLTTYLRYIIVFALSVIFVKNYQSNLLRSQYETNITKNYLLFFLVIAPPVFLASFRYNTGVDYWNYVERFNLIKGADFSQLLQDTSEPGFVLLNIVAGYLTPNSDVGIFFIVSFLTLFFLLKSLTYYLDDISYPFGLFIYFMVYYIETFNIMRQLLAVSIFLYSIKYLLQKRRLAYILFVAFAGSIHLSALMNLAFLFIPFGRKNYHKKNFILFLIIILSPFMMESVFIIGSKITIFEKYFSSYKPTNAQFGFGFLLDVFPILIAFMFFRSYFKTTNYNILLYISVMTIPLRILGYYQIYAARLSHYTSITQIIIIPLIISLVKGKNNKVIISGAFILYYIIFFIITYVIFNKGPAYPYYSVFTQ